MSKYVLVRNGMDYDPNTGLGGAREDGLLAIANDFIEDSGVIDFNGGDLAVAQQASPNMSVKMAKGRLWIKSASWVQNTYDKNKFYPILIDAIESVNIDANSSGSTRYDLVCIKIDLVNPPGDSGESAVTIEVVKGTPGAGVPATPANHYKCAEIEVINGATSITTSKITDRRNQLKINSNFISDVAISNALATATEKTSVVDGDFFSILDSAASFLVKKLTWANIKAGLKTYFDPMYTSNSIYRQAIINGNFDVWQRLITSTNPTSGAFVADRWKIIYSADGGTLPTSIIHSRQAVTPGDILGSFYHYRVSLNGAGSGFGASSVYMLRHYIEHGTRLLCGLNKKVTLSFYARSSISGKKLGVFLWQNYGSGGSPSAQEDINGQTFTLSSNWTKYTVTLPTSTLVNKVFGSNNDDSLQVLFGVQWGSGSYQTRFGATGPETFVGSGNIDITQVQVCAGDVDLPFVPKSFDEELKACMRYFEKSYPYATALGGATAAGIQSKFAINTWDFYDDDLLFTIPKRIAPTMTFYSYSTGAVDKIRDFTSGADLTFTNANNVPYKSETHVTLSGNNTLVANRQYFLHWTADAEL